MDKKEFLKPLKLFNDVQHYSWGTRNDEAFIPKLLNQKAEKDKPYAELWIGAHPKAPSKVQIHNELIPLNVLIKENPEEILGSFTNAKYAGKLPFLFKVLSAGQALSIQTHPNKDQAIKLHKDDPGHYPDDNHKPEIAIAIDELKALVGVKSLKELIEVISEYRSLAGIIDICDYSPKAVSENDKNDIEKIFSAIMLLYNDEVTLKESIDELLAEINDKSTKSKADEYILENYELYGYDVGLFSFLLLNLAELDAGKAIFTDAGIPHAYLKGNIIECMANSDNVVRAGLTSKFKDINTLLDIIKVNNEAHCEMKSEFPYVVYETDAEEFVVKKILIGKDEEVNIETNEIVQIALVTKGKIVIDNHSTESTVCFASGDSFIIPSLVKMYRVKAKSDLEMFLVTVPKT